MHFNKYCRNKTKVAEKAGHVARADCGFSKGWRVRGRMYAIVSKYIKYEGSSVVECLRMYESPIQK